MNSDKRVVINFGAGPAKIPAQVLKKAQDEMLDYGDTGISIMELSHRDKFADVIESAEETLRELLNIPSNYKIIFLQGGGRGQFSAIPMNLLCRSPSKQADYVVTGYWSAMAAKEAQKYGKVNLVFPKPQRYTTIPDQNGWCLSPESAYVYYCANETVDGVEFYDIPETNGIPLVCDMSSNLLSRPFDITKFGVVFAGAQKNLGCAGVTLVIVREDLLGNAMPQLPDVWDYRKQIDMHSGVNTPPTFNIYILDLTLQWVKNQGGLKEMERLSNEKSNKIYKTIQEGFYVSNIDPKCQSRTTIPFRIGNPHNELLEKKFLQEAVKRNMIQLKGHRSVGGLRVSIYNAITMDEVNLFVEFLNEFCLANSPLLQ